MILALAATLANAGVWTAIAAIALCRIVKMDDINTRRFVRWAYAVVFAGAFAGAGLFGGALLSAATQGHGLFGDAFQRAWGGWLGWWWLVMSIGPLGLLMSTAQAWREGIPAHARPASAAGAPAARPALTWPTLPRPRRRCRDDGLRYRLAAELRARGMLSGGA